MRKNVMSSLMLLLALCSISSGCVDPMIVDEIQMVSALGYDAADDGQLKITTAVPLYLPSKEVQTETYTAIVPILKSTPKFINAESSQPFVVGKIEVVLISSELAEQGVNSLIDSLSRDPYVGAQIYVAIVQGETQALLEKKLGQNDNGSYLSSMLEHAVETIGLPDTNLHRFLYAYYADGLDPVLPLIQLKEDKAAIIGTALFKGDRMVGHIPLGNEMSIFKMLLENSTKQDTFALPVSSSGDKKTYASINKLNSKRSIHVQMQGETPKITIYLSMEGHVREYSGTEKTEQIKPNIKEQLEQMIQIEAEKLIEQFQEAGIDPLGIGEKAKSRYRNWNAKKWEEQYRMSNIAVHVNVTITEAGVTK